MTCETCTEKITIHADATAACGCELVPYVAGRSDWPTGWQNDADEISMAIASEAVA